MTYCPFFPHSLTIDAAFAPPTASANAPALSANLDQSLVCLIILHSPTWSSISLDSPIEPGSSLRSRFIAGAGTFGRLTLTPQSLAATYERLKNRGQDNDRAGREQLQGRIDVVELKNIGQSAEHDRAGDRADHGARAAEQAGAADDHRGDRRQFVTGAVVGAPEIELAGMNDAGDGGDQTRDRIDG